MAEQHYRGACQCGAVAYEVDVDLDGAVSCNCSRCQRIGAILAFAPADKFALKSGEAHLTEYRFNTGKIAHLFCRVCGVESFARGVGPGGAAVAAINVNCLEGVEPRTLNPTLVDGRSY